MKRLLTGLLMFWVGVGMFVSADIVLSGSFEDSFTRTSILPNLRNIATADLSATQLAGRIAFDSTLRTITSDDGSGWRPVMTRYLSRTASHIEVTNAAVPTIGSCTGGAVDTGSTDSAGRVSGITGSTCYLTFNNYYLNTPFAVLSRSNTQGGTGELRYVVFTTGIDVYAGLLGASGGDAFSYIAIGRY